MDKVVKEHKCTTKPDAENAKDKMTVYIEDSDEKASRAFGLDVELAQDAGASTVSSTPRLATRNLKTHIKTVKLKDLETIAAIIIASYAGTSVEDGNIMNDQRALIEQWEEIAMDAIKTKKLSRSELDAIHIGLRQVQESTTRRHHY